MRLEAARENVTKLENELLNTSILIDDIKSPKISKQSFLLSQSKEKIRDNSVTSRQELRSVENINDLIKTNNEKKHNAENNKELGIYNNNSDTNESEELFTKKTSDERDYIFQIKLMDEKRRIEIDYKQKEKRYESIIDELKHKRICDKEKYRDVVENLERQLGEAKAACESFEHSFKSLKNENSMLQASCRDLRIENERLISDIDRLQHRLESEKLRLPQLEGRYKSEIESYERKMNEYEILLADYKEFNSKLKLKNDSLMKKLECLDKTVLDLEQALSGEKATSRRVQDEYARLEKRIKVETENYETNVNQQKIRINELEGNITTLMSTLEASEMQIDVLKQQIGDLETSNLKLTKDTRELSHINEILESTRTRNNTLMLENNKLKSELSHLSTDFESAYKKMLYHQQRADEAEVEYNNLRRRIELMHDCNHDVNKQKISKDTENQLVDYEGQPLSKLGNNAVYSKFKSKANIESRPGWWYADSQYKDESILNNVKSNDYIGINTLQVPIKKSFICCSEDNQTINPNTKYEISASGILESEKRSIAHRINRTTEENEEYENLKSRLMQIDEELKMFKM